MEWDFIPTPHLFMISVSCCEASRTCLRRLSTNTERGVRDSPQPMAGGAGIWEPAPWPAGVAGTGKVGGRCGWYLLIHLLLQVGEGHAQQVERPASIPAQGIRELQGHSTNSPSSTTWRPQRSKPNLLIPPHLHPCPAGIIPQHQEDPGALGGCHVDVILQDGGSPEDPLLFQGWGGLHGVHSTHLQVVRAGKHQFPQ